MKAHVICRDLLNTLNAEQKLQGRVHSVFNKAINFETEYGIFFTLVSSEEKIAPMTIALSHVDRMDFKKINIIQHDRFFMDKAKLLIESRDMKVELREIVLWNPEIEFNGAKCSESQLLRNIRRLELDIPAYGKLYGIGPLLPTLGEQLPELDIRIRPPYNIDKSFEFIKNRFVTFIKSVIAMDGDNISQAAAGIIGFGAGLTPAADDFISGLMFSLVYLSLYFGGNSGTFKKFNKRLISEGVGRTTKVSEEMLKCSAEGKGSDALGQLLKAVLSEKKEEAVTEKLINLMACGETSGTDTALGVYVGCKIMTSITYRGGVLYEAKCGHQEEYLL